MKHLYLFLQLIIVGLLLAGCSSKEFFKFSKDTGSFGSYQKIQKATNLQDSATILNETSKIEQIPDSSSVLTASSFNPAPTQLPKQKPFVSNNPDLTEKKIKLQPYQPAVKNRIPKSFKIKKHLIEPETKKKVQEAALIGFILSLAAVVILFAGSFLSVPFGLVGLLFSIIGLSRIKKKPEKFFGKGFAWAGIIVGIIIPLFIVGYLLAFAGAFGS